MHDHNSLDLSLSLKRAENHFHLEFIGCKHKHHRALLDSIASNSKLYAIYNPFNPHWMFALNSDRTFICGEFIYLKTLITIVVLTRAKSTD